MELEVGIQQEQDLWLEDMQFLPSDGDSGDSGGSALGQSSQVQQSAVHVPAVAAASAGFDVSRWDFAHGQPICHRASMEAPKAPSF